MMSTPRHARNRLVSVLLAAFAAAALLVALPACESKTETKTETKKDDNTAAAQGTTQGTATDDGTATAPGATEQPAALALELVEVDLAGMQAAIKDAGAAGAKAVLVNAWATWCVPCVEEFPHLVKLSNEYRDKGLTVLFVSADEASERPAVLEFLQKHGVTGKSFLKTGDEDAFINGMHPKWDGSLPATFVYDATGQQVASLIEPATYERFAALVDPVLSGEQKAAPVDTATTGVTLGDTIPTAVADIPMKSVDGTEVTLATLPGEKGKLVVFTCNHCPYAKQWAERLTELGNRYAEQGIGVVAINPNDPVAYPEDDYPTMQKEAERLGMKFPYVVDGTSDVARAFGATKTPHVYLFGADGKLVYVGAIDDNSADPDKVTRRWLDEALGAVVEGKPVPTAESKAVGCSIKWREGAAQ